MISKIKSEYERFQVRRSKIEALGEIKPISAEQVDRAFNELGRFMDRAGAIRKMQKNLLAVFEIVEGADFHIQPSTKKKLGEESIPPLTLALKKLAAFTKAPRLRRRSDGEVIRVFRLDGYVPPSDRRNTLYVFSSSPRPGVYALPLNAIDVSTSPSYEPLEEK